MARPFARATNIRYYSGSSSSNGGGRRVKKPCKKKSKKSKTGRGKQEEGDSGSSEEGSTSSPRTIQRRRRRISIISWAGRASCRNTSQKPANTQEKISPFFPICTIRTCTARREDGGESSPTPLSPPATAPALPPAAVVFVVEDGREGRWGRRDRGGSRRPHCPVDGKEGPAQQGVHGEGAERPEGPPLRPHRHQVLRRAGPPRLRPPQQGC